MDHTQNKFGIRRITLKVDGRQVFQSLMDEFMPDENPLVNSWGDYPHYRKTKHWYLKSFIEPGNRLRMLQASNGNRGLVEINEERPYRFVYTLSDALGNTSKVRFTVQGQKTIIAPVEHREKYTSNGTR